MKNYICVIIKTLSGLINHIIVRTFTNFRIMASGIDHSINNDQTFIEIYEFKPYQIQKINFMNDIKSKYPTARSGHRTVCTDGNLYSLGGFNPEHHNHNIDINRGRRRRYQTTVLLFQELWKFNFADKRWTLCLNHNKKNMPQELASNAVILKNSTLIAFGGTAYPFGEACSNQCYIFNVDRSNISVIHLNVSGNLPTPQYGPAIVLHNNYLYTIGGTTGFEYSCDVYRLDLITRRWESVYICKPGSNHDPPGRYRHEVVYTGKLIYVLGGGTAQIAFSLNILPAFDLDNNNWMYISTKPDPLIRNNNHAGYPGPRKCYSCVQYTNDDGSIEAVISGGYFDSNIYYSDVWKLDFKILQWKCLSTASLPNPIYFHSAATPGNGCMYLFGGIEMSNTNILSRTNNLYKVWTKIPKLSEICWDAISHYNPNLGRNHTKDELYRLGIPIKFIKRLTITNK